VRDPIVAGTGETETQTETVTENETKTETSPTDEVPPGYRAAVQRELDYQSQKLDEVLQTKKQSSVEEFQNFISNQIPVSEANESKMVVWRAQEAEHAREKDRLPTTLYGPFVREKFFPLLAEAYVTNEYEWVVWAEEMLIKFKSYAFHRKHLSEMECTVWNPETQREEHYTFEELYAAVAERSAILKEEKRKEEDHQYRLQVNEQFQNAVNLMIKEKYPSGGYREFLRIKETDYHLIDPYTTDGITVTADNFMDLFEAKCLEYQKNSDFWKKLKHGDIVFFGRYEQDGIAENGPEAILWKVFLNSQTDTLSLLSVYDLDIMQWTTDYTKKETNYWANSEIRAWLNGEFYQSAFTAEEKEMIQLTHLVNDWEILPWPGMSEHRGSGGPDTEDYVFLFSIKEDSDNNPSYGYPRSPTRDNPTAYAEAKAKLYEHLDTKTPFTWYRGGDRRMGPYWETDGMQAYGYVAPMINLNFPVSE